MTFDATPPLSFPADLDLASSGRLTVCDLSGVERFLVWAVRWCASLQALARPQARVRPWDGPTASSGD